MIVLKLIALATLVGVALGESSEPSPTPEPLYIHNVFEEPNVIHDAFLQKQKVEPTHHYRYGYEIHDPNTAVTTSQYEIRYNDVNIGIHSLGTQEGQRRTVTYTLDATNGYHATLSEGSQEDMTLDYPHLASPLASSTPPSTDEKETFKTFLVDDKENIDKHSPEAESAYYTHTTFTDYFNVLFTQDCTWGYEIDGNRSQYAIHRGGNIEGRITMVNADGCVSSMDYTMDADNFNVSTVRHFGKQDISQLYLNPEQYPLLLQIARGPSTCKV